ncbi:hypothetical protein H4219_004560 [Mycoemilia scoparia]|uniref:Uncharacterized protein n=1 Tax=Mycoemilia scoparia TaxID=417184 RepID=A0A9W7ZS10_9FUNG|nr:hypothetical protein H4219_004560 [Mycoemilia scoparia]
MQLASTTTSIDGATAASISPNKDYHLRSQNEKYINSSSAHSNQVHSASENAIATDEDDDNDNHGPPNFTGNIGKEWSPRANDVAATPVQQNNHSANEEKYRKLKRKLKEVLEENRRVTALSKRKDRQIARLRQEKELLLDHIEKKQKGWDDSRDDDGDDDDDLLSVSSSASSQGGRAQSDGEDSDVSLMHHYNKRWAKNAAHAGYQEYYSQRNHNNAFVPGVDPSQPTMSTPHRNHASIGSAGVSGRHHHRTHKNSPLLPSASAKTTPLRNHEYYDHAGMSPATPLEDESPYHHHGMPPMLGADDDEGEAGSMAVAQRTGRLSRKKRRQQEISSRVRSVQPVPRDKDGNYILPIQVGILTVLDLGHVVWDRDTFHNERYIWPVGYTVQREYGSMVDPEKNVIYTCRITDGGDGPRFHIEPEDMPDKPIIATSATGAWTHAVKVVNQIRQRDHSNSASGPDYFGFSHPTIAKMIQDLPGVDKCRNYVLQKFVEMKERHVRGVMKKGRGGKPQASMLDRGRRALEAQKDRPENATILKGLAANETAAASSSTSTSETDKTFSKADSLIGTAKQPPPPGIPESEEGGGSDAMAASPRQESKEAVEEGESAGQQDPSSAAV